MESNKLIHPTPVVQSIVWGLVEWEELDAYDRYKIWGHVQKELRKNKIFIRRVTPEPYRFSGPSKLIPATQFELWGDQRYHKGKQHWHRLLSPAREMAGTCEIAMAILAGKLGKWTVQQ